ncbi:cobyrinate a,c-diamide synthase [Mycoplasma sp. P36-A1]|uniref:cobyrinate a,c-diamide synthase n=1 Tax=Mycoplasma sp. P36-A1 TaxID=3252900 RepID=UPI003C3043D4
MNNKNRIMIAGTHSGAGKTTTVCALIKLLQDKNIKVNSFKCGPDYVDPMFHNVVLKNECTNLDLFLMKKKGVIQLLNEHTANNELALIEGVMGYYDGMGGTSSEGSACDVSLQTKTPTILVVNGSGISVSLLAMIEGYKKYAKNMIVGVIINNVSDSFYPIIKEQIEDKLKLKVFGYLRTDQRISISHRYLGLLQPHELENINERMDYLCDSAKETIDLDAIIKASQQAEELINEPFEYPQERYNVTIGVVKDKAFNFIYKDNILLLERFGAKIKYISLLEDKQLPNDIDGLIIPGGYPELFLEQLTSNKSIKASIKQRVANKMPLIAESGGFVYLGSSYEVEGIQYEMANVIPMKSVLNKTLQPFGYVENTSLIDNIYAKKGTVINAHEFHYASSDIEYNAMKAQKPNRKRNWLTNYTKDNIFAGYSQFHYYADLNMALNFVKVCAKYSTEKE